MKLGLKCVAVLMGLIPSLLAMASGGGPAVADGVNYVEIAPALVVNYGGPGKPRFIKAELSIRTETGAAATEVMHHLPLIRDRLVSILSAQTEEAISTAEGKEYLRVYALAEINKALLKVEGHSVDEHDAKHSADKKKDAAKKVAKHDDEKESGHTAVETQTSAVPSLDSVKPVKGPASDLFFNNFVVQK